MFNFLKRETGFPFAYGATLKGFVISLVCDGESVKSIQRTLFQFSSTFTFLGASIPDRRTLDKWADGIKCYVDDQLKEFIEEVLV